MSLALVCYSIGIAWLVIGAFVLLGAARAGLRAGGLDPLGPFLGNGERAAVDGALAIEPQGFGGSDVPGERR